MSAIERSKALLELLKSSARPCPSDAALACELQCSEEQAAEALAFLDATGLVRVSRQVEVLQTGNGA